MTAAGGFDPIRLARLDKHFSRHVDDGRLAGWQLGLSSGAEVVHEAAYGWRDREAGRTVESDTIWRIASMTKPITSVAAMTLWEEGAFELTDPISRWLPEFEDMRVYVKGHDHTMVTVPATEPIRVWHLLTQTSGLTAGFMRTSIVDQLYREAGYELGAPAGHDLAACVADWARLPLLFQPGTAWAYGVSTDVLGRLVELWTGQSLDVAFANRVLDPLGMTDTAFFCDPSKKGRLAALYYAGDDGQALRSPANEIPLDTMPAVLSGGGGLLSTLRDYLRFTRMLAGGGELDGTRLLSPRTVRLMASNHLGADLATMSTGGFAETTFDGVGFGLGFAVLEDPRMSHSPASPGEFYWGGIFSTGFWVDPVDAISCVFMTQLMPSSFHPIRSQLRQHVYSSLIR